MDSVVRNMKNVASEEKEKKRKKDLALELRKTANSFYLVLARSFKKLK